MTSKRLTKEMELQIKLDPAFQDALAVSRQIDWQPKALCNEYPLDLFYPIGYTTAADKEQAERAKSVCHRCPVRASCLRETLELDDRWGVRGGYDEPTRKLYHQVFERYYRKGAKPPTVAALLSGVLKSA